MRYFPIFDDRDRQPVLVLGGEQTARPTARGRLAANFPPGIGSVLVGRLRSMLLAHVPQRLVRRIVNVRATAAVPADDSERPRDLADEATAGIVREGSVVLVGAGPGDPELLTLKAHRALQAADVLVIDRLVDPRVVALARRDARRIHVGKVPGGPSTRQAAINAILVEEALAGHRVVRLKGGDPLVFGRAVEEIDAVEAAGIPVEIVPGVTAALAAAAAARLPLTERGRRRALTILTGQTRDGPAEHDWPALARGGQTLAVYMGIAAGPAIARHLLAAGIAPETPVTIVENATLPQQRTATGPLADAAGLLLRAGIRGPAILFIGVAPLPAATAEPQPRQLERAA